MCEVCSELNVNAYLADNWAKQYEDKEQVSPGFLQATIATDEMNDVLTAVHYGNEGHAFFSSAGIETYQDLVNRLWELAKPPVAHLQT